MGSYTWKDTNEYTSDTQNEFKKSWHLWSIYNSYISKNIPRYSTITKVTFSVDAKQNLSLSSGSIEAFLGVYADDVAGDDVVTALPYQDNAVKNSYKTFSNPVTSYFTLTGHNSGSPGNIINAGVINYLCVYCHSSIIRKHSIKNISLIFEYNDQYTISTSVSPSGAGTISGGGTKTAGTTITLTANPATGYEFKQWSDKNTSNPRITTVTGNTTYTAQFTKKSYTISVSGTNGAVTGGGTYEYGTTATLTATPNTGYKFVRWNDNNTQNPRTITVTGDTTYTAYFEKLTYPITFKNWDGTILQSSNWEYGSIPSYSGIPTKPADNQYIYSFKGWSPSITSVTTSATYTAQFDAIEREYEIVINPNGGIYNNSTDNTTVLAKYQSIINIDNPQKENNIFTHWSLSGTTPLKIIQTANGYTDYYSTNTSTKFTHNLSQDGTYTNYRWYNLSATSNAWNNLTFNTYSVSANETITITGYIRINGISAAQLNFYHGEKVNDYANNKFGVKDTNNEWKKFSFSRTFTTATDTAVFQIYTGNLANLTGEINFDLKGIQIIRENGTILPTVIQINGDNLNLTANYREYQISFKSVKIYYPTDNEIASPNNPLISGEKAQIIVQVKLE